MMKKPPTKRQVRQQLENQMSTFLSDGGEVREVIQGDSGLENGKYNDSGFGFEKPKETRTLVNDVVNDLENRRKPHSSPKPAPTLRRPRKKVIYDDFGEPLREVWVDQ
jgi:hypothetical protein